MGAHSEESFLDSAVPGAVESAMAESAPPPDRRSGLRIALLAVFAAIILMAVGGILAYTSLKGGNNSADRKASAAINAAAAANSAAVSNKDAADKLAQQLQQNGIQPSVTATANSTPSPGPAGPSGATGATGPAPSSADVLQAVTAYCNSTPGICVGVPTQAQVAAAVSQYCTANGQCRGPAGADATGAAGPTGAQGQPGQNATDAQVASAVSSYCSIAGNCVGPVGPTGPSGAVGATGVSGYPPGSFTVIVPGVISSPTETCTPNSSPGPGTQPTYACK